VARRRSCRRTGIGAGNGGTTDRQAIGGILWKLPTGATWRDLPARFGPWQTADDRPVRRRRDGAWAAILAALRAAVDAAGEVDRSVFVDATMVRADQPAAGARRRPCRAEKQGNPAPG